MGIKVSYSAVESYLTCSEKFRLERIEKIIPEEIRTPLMFGKACDSASELIFKDKIKGENYLAYDEANMLKILKDNLVNIDYQGDQINAIYSTKVKYSKADVQPELLLEEDIKLIREFIDSKNIELENIYQYIEWFKNQKKHKQDEIEVYNYIAHHALYRKGELLLKALKQWVDDNIEEVISIQRYFKIENEEGDVLSGLIDLEAILKRDPNKVYTLDLKTSTGAKSAYPDGCVEESKQLAIYSEFSNPDCGYVVLDKAIKVRNPRVKIHEVYGVVDESIRDEVFEMVDKALVGIKANIFEKNFDACISKHGKCSFYEYCRSGDRKGLVPRYPEKVVDN